MARTPSASGGAAVGPPGKATVAPLVRCSSRPLAAAMVGAPEPLRLTAPAQSHCAPFKKPSETGSAANESAASDGAGPKVGDSSLRKCAKGVASSPGGGLI